MAKNSIAVYGAEGKSNLLFFDPDRLHLVVDEASPLYDERVHLPVSERMVRSIMYKGVIQPIVVAKDPETGNVDVAAGRQRVKAAREANRRLIERGDPPIQVPAYARRYVGDGTDLMDVMVIENEIRDADSPLRRAAKMQRLRDRGRDDDAIAVVFGCSKATVVSTLALLDCTKVVREAVEAGSINVGHAKSLSKMEPEAQREKVAELVAAGVDATPRERARAQREVLDPGRPRMKTRRQILAERDATDSPPWRAALSWVLGEEATLL